MKLFRFLLAVLITLWLYVSMPIFIAISVLIFIITSFSNGFSDGIRDVNLLWKGIFDIWKKAVYKIYYAEF